jgi:hypothetical protein
MRFKDPLDNGLVEDFVDRGNLSKEQTRLLLRGSHIRPLCMKIDQPFHYHIFRPLATQIPAGTGKTKATRRWLLFRVTSADYVNSCTAPARRTW